MKTYNYFYDGTPITKAQFLKAVPENWQNEVENGEYSWGYYRAVENRSKIMKPEDLLDKTKVYQFIKATESRNTIDKLSLPKDKKSLYNLLKSIQKWMNWHDAQNSV